MKKAGVSDEDLKFFYIMKIRSVLESNAVVFHSMMTNDDTDDLERVQRNVVRTIMGQRYNDYDSALDFLNLESLEKRRETLCLTFALKCLRNPKFRHWFELTPQNPYSLRETRKFLEPLCHKERYFNSPLVYLERLLNNYCSPD